MSRQDGPVWRKGESVIMALSIDYSRVVDHETLCVIPENERDSSGEWMHPVTKALGFASMFIGLGEITETNAVDFYTRLRAYELIGGTILRTPEGEERPITPEDVRRHVGLRMNVSKETDAWFARQLWRIAKDRAGEVWRKHTAASV